MKEQTRIYKLKSAIVFIRECKNEELILTFARVRLTNPGIADAKLRQKCLPYRSYSVTIYFTRNCQNESA